MAKKSYIDIGHDDPNAELWVFTPKKKLLTMPAKDGVTHEIAWGIECLNWFRGRYDTKTCELSMIYPVTWPKYYGLPIGLEDVLQNEFGECKRFEFNPGKRRK